MSLKIGSWFTTQQNAARLPEEIAEPQSPQKITAEEAVPVDIKRTNRKIEKIFNTIISKLSTTLTQIKEKTISLFSAVGIQLTDTKIKQIFLGAISGYSLIGAGVIAGGLIPIKISSFAAAIPLVAISGAVLWHAISLIDYQNPSTLNEIRDETKHLSLNEIVKKHGWKNLFQFELLDPKSFNDAYRAYAESLSFSEILSLYKESSRELHLIPSTQRPSTFAIPTPSEWEEKFTQELLAHGATILDELEISDLKSFNTLPIHSMRMLEKYLDRRDQQKLLIKEFQKITNILLANLDENSSQKIILTKIVLNLLTKRTIQDFEISNLKSLGGLSDDQIALLKKCKKLLDEDKTANQKFHDELHAISQKESVEDLIGSYLSIGGMILCVVLGLKLFKGDN